jgi:hypothetical protein
MSFYLPCNLTPFAFEIREGKNRPKPPGILHAITPAYTEGME